MEQYGLPILPIYIYIADDILKNDWFNKEKIYFSQVKRVEDIIILVANIKNCT